MTRNNGHGRSTEPKGGRNGKRQNSDELLIVHLAARKTITETAKLTGISVRTIHRRLEDADFEQRILVRQDEMVNRTIDKLCDASTKAVRTAVKLLDDPNPSIRLRAVRTILEFGLKLKLQQEILQRTEALEADVRDLKT